MKKIKIVSLALTTIVALSVCSLSTGQAVNADVITEISNLAGVNTTSSTTTVPFKDANGKTIANTTVSDATAAVKNSLMQTTSNSLLSSQSAPMKGIDIYSGTDVTDWNAVKNAGVQAVYIKLTDGLTYNNPKALAQYNGAKSVGLKVGAYHFAENNSVDSEYNHFASQLALYKWDLKPVLDYEPSTIDYSFISAFMAKDANLIYYGSHSTADNTGLPISRIWIAEPSDISGGYAFTGTTKGYAGIQYLFHGSINGSTGDSDVDLFSDSILLHQYLPELLWIDTPTEGSTVTDSINVVGWTLNDSGNRQVDILVDGKENGIATLGLPRTDVQGAFPAYGVANCGYSYNLDVSNLDYGNHNITVKSTGNDGSIISKNINIVTVAKTSASTGVGVTYRGQVENLGWLPYVSDGSEAGTEGQSLRIEALDMKLVNAPAGASIQYQAHVQNVGWQNPVQDGADAGTIGQGLRVEALKIKLINMPTYSVQYQAYVQNIGWMPFVSEGATAGTVGQDLRVEAMRVKIVPKVATTSISLNKSSDTINAGNADTLGASISPTNATDKNVNWTSSNNAVATVDDTGKTTGVSAGNSIITATSEDGSKTATCTVTVPNINVSSISLNKTTDSLNVGVSDTLSATINPTNATDKNVNWTSSNNAVATVDNTGKITGVATGSATITVASENGSKTATCNVNVVNNLPVGVSYMAHVQNIGWMPSVIDGAEGGTDGKGLRVEALKISLVNAPAGASIQYQAHVENLGWQAVVQDGAEAGTDGQGLRVEAFKINLLSMPGYTVQYRAHVQNIGWMPWVQDGVEAGTDGLGLRVEAIEIRVVAK